MNRMLQHFTKAADHMSISQASIELGVSQPAISKSIKSLEVKLGVELLKRHARGISLTTEGEVVYQRAKKIEFEFQSIERDILTLKNDNEILRIGAGPSWQKPISTVLPEFLIRFPKVNLSIKAAPISQLITPLINNEIDLAFGVENGSLFVKNNELSFTPIFDNHLCIIARREHPLNITKPRQTSALSHYPWVAFQSSKEILDHVNKLLEREGGNSVRYILETEFLDMALNVIKNTDSLLCISSQLFKNINDDNIVILNIPESIWHFHLGVWTQPQKSRSILVDEFLNLLSKSLN